MVRTDWQWMPSSQTSLRKVYCVWFQATGNTMGIKSAIVTLVLMTWELVCMAEAESCRSWSTQNSEVGFFLSCCSVFPNNPVLHTKSREGRAGQSLTVVLPVWRGAMNIVWFCLFDIWRDRQNLWQNTSCLFANKSKLAFILYEEANFLTSVQPLVASRRSLWGRAGQKSYLSWHKKWDWIQACIPLEIKRFLTLRGVNSGTTSLKS